MSEAWIRRALVFSGVWNLVGGAMTLADPAAHFAQMYRGALALGDPLQAFFFRATWINVMAWGVAYMLASRYRFARKGVLFAGGVGKLAYFGACMALVASGVGKPALLGFAVMDVIFALYFFAVAWREDMQERATVLS